ncbi:hypothetical protein BJX65DRAFT_308348 [Aspergillus insuetus]
MEAPLVEDSMEMASPYHGHADDFEIDIDVMEDQASNPDKDMTATDEYMDNSHSENYGHDDSPDEDMVDDPAEPSMIDADEYRETNQNLEMQYEEGKNYEAEMLEDEYDEDIDAPVPEQEQEVPTLLGHPENQESAAAGTLANDKNVNEDGANERSFETEVKHPNEVQTDEQQYQEHAVEEPEEQQQADEPEPETIRSEVGCTEDLATRHIQEEQGELKTTRDRSSPDDFENPLNAAKEEDDSEPAQISFDDPKEADVHSHGGQQLSEQTNKEAEQEHESAEYPPLHPVKVYYQENEMSLFPPREGDSTETFFLENEGLAYGSFEKLFESCREVLQDHINENEVLVVDIDPLNIQISEDSRETDKITLKQIVDVYLHLCHNDGVEGSEALYLTLSTKLTITAELSDLFLAASEGKGLSEIQPWETYPDEADGDSAELNETAQEPFPQEPQDTLDTLDHGEDEAHETGSTIGNQDVSNPEQTEPAAGTVENVEHDDYTATVHEADTERNPSVANDSSPVGSHDMEEQNTASTGTVEPLPPTDMPEEQSGAGDEATDPYDGENNEDEYYYQDDATHYEEEVQVDAIEFLDSEGKVAGDHTDNLSEGPTEEYQDLERSYHEPHISEDITGDDALRDNEAVSVEKPQTQDSDKETETSLKVSPSTSQAQEVPPLLDYSLGTAEDLLESAGNDSKADVELDQTEAANELEELGEVVEHTSDLPADQNEAADLPFDDEDYLNLGFEEDPDAFDEENITASPSHVSVKRTREPEDELDLPESPTPEAKRSRSS